MGDFGLIWIVLLLPVVGFLIQSLLGKRIAETAGKRVLGTIAVLPIALGFVVGLLLTQKLAGLSPDARSVVVPGFDWISVMGLRIPFEALVDPLSMTMVLIITGIGSLIHLYATGYMAEEKDYARFFTYLNLFVASMLMLVLGNNLALLFIGWEGVGLCSYLLIGFWYKDLNNSKAANKAFITNRIGDWGLTLGIFGIFALLAGNASQSSIADGRWLSYDTMLPALTKALAANPGMATVIGLLLFVGACGKSAQFPLYLWLPDAMAGPTPVSALIHAATMVTSGVVLLNRMHVVFEYSTVASAVIAGVGAFTALFAALVAFGQTDIKKVLAYSTVSQLGFMFVACGSGAYWAGMFHVTTHAFFKALLFLGSGAVIHAMAHNQDMRNYGGLQKYLKITFITMLTGYIAISGFAIPHVFGFAGYYSKEAIIGSALAGNHAVLGEGASEINVGVISGWVALFTAFLTACYMTRMTWLTFFGPERWRQIPVAVHHEHEEHEHEHSHEHVHHGAHDHGPDVHGFFYTDEEVAAREEHEHAHHELDGSHAPHEVPPSMWVPLALLAVASVFSGYFMEHDEAFYKWLYPNNLPILGEVSVHPHHVDLVMLSAIAAFGGLILGAAVYWKGLPKSEGWDLSKWNPLRKLAGNQFGYDAAMMTLVVEGGDGLGKLLWKGFDAGFVDGIVNGIGLLATSLGKGLRVLQTGLVRGYALLMVLGGLFIMGYFVYALNILGGVR